MTMEPPDERSAPQPRVIDLDAEEIRPAPEPEPAPPPPQPQPKRRSRLGLIAALLLGLAAGLLLYRGVLSNYLPSSQMTALKNQVAALETNTADLNGQLAAVRDEAKAAAAAATAAKAAAGEAGQAAAGASEAASGLRQPLDETAQRVAGLAADVASLRNAIATAGAGAGTGTGADGAALAALSQRLDALEKDVASLKTSGGASGQPLALSQALSDLKAKIAAGAPYAAEYDRIARMAPAAPGLDVLAANAAQGLPDAMGLAGELRAAIPDLPKPAIAPPEDNSYFGMAMKALSGIITIRPIGETDWPQLAEKAAAFAEAGDLTQAIAAIEAGEGDEPPALSQWRERAAARLRLEAALAGVSDAVLRQLAATGGATP